MTSLTVANIYLNTITSNATIAYNNFDCKFLISDTDILKYTFSNNTLIMNSPLISNNVNLNFSNFNLPSSNNLFKVINKNVKATNSTFNSLNFSSNALITNSSPGLLEYSNNILYFSSSNSEQGVIKTSFHFIENSNNFNQFSGNNGLGYELGQGFVNSTQTTFNYLLDANSALTTSRTDVANLFFLSANTAYHFKGLFGLYRYEYTNLDLGYNGYAPAQSIQFSLQRGLDLNNSNLYYTVKPKLVRSSFNDGSRDSGDDVLDPALINDSLYNVGTGTVRYFTSNIAPLMYSTSTLSFTSGFPRILIDLGSDANETEWLLYLEVEGFVFSGNSSNYLFPEFSNISNNKVQLMYNNTEMNNRPQYVNGRYLYITPIGSYDSTSSSDLIAGTWA